MKRFILLTLISVIVISIFAQSPLNLSIKLEKNVVNKIASVSIQHAQNTYNGQSITTEVDARTSISFKLLSQDEDIMRIEFKFDTIQSTNKSPNGTKVTNSAVIAKKTEYLEQLLNRFSSGTIIAKISTKGKFKGFENYRNFSDAILTGLDSIPESKKNQIQKQADMFIKESAIQSMIEPIFAFLPETSVKVGDVWETSYSITGGGLTGMIFNTLTLDSIVNSTARISFKTELESIPSNDPNVQMSIELKGTSTGTMAIDLKTGLMLRNSELKNYSGTLNIKNQGNAMSIPMVIETKSEVLRQ